MTIPLWILVIAGLLAVGGLLAAAFFLGRRARTRKPPAVTKQPSSAGGWREILGKLPASARALPVVVVLGERGSGKSRLIRTVFGSRTGFTGEAVTARDDTTVSAFMPGHVLVQEIAGELFEAEGSDGLIRLHDLWRPMALEIALVVFVGPASGSPDRHAQRIRRIIDVLTDVRGGSPPRCCVCVTRLDETTEGFAELVSAADQAGADTLSPISVASAGELRAVWDDRFRDCYYAALAHLPASAFARAARFPEKSGPELARYVDGVLRGVFRGRPAGMPTLLALLATTEQGGAALLGDPFAPDEARFEDDRRVLEQRRALRSAALAVSACGLIAFVYLWHHGKLQRAMDTVTTLRLAAARARTIERGTRDVITAEPEIQAASAIDTALTPLYFPLRLAFPEEKDSLVKEFVDQIRSLYLQPLTAAPDRATRVYAASLMYSTRDGPLGRAVRADPRRWSAVLGMPPETALHYVDYSKEAYSGKPGAAALSERDIATTEWAEFFDQLDAIVARGGLRRPEELAELQARAERLTVAMRWAVQEPELRSLIQLLELERGAAEVEPLLGGKSASLLQAPAWVIEHREPISAVLAMVKKGEVAVPSAAGKTLRQVLGDLDAIGKASAGASGGTPVLQIDGKTREYPAEAWAQVLLESRSTFYMAALLEDLVAPRSLFFADVRSYPDVAPSAVLGRGPSASIPGTYTPAAFDTEIRGPVLSIDAKLDAAKVSDTQRIALKVLIQRELESYGAGLNAALYAYLQSFRFDAPDVDTLRGHVVEMTGGSSWFAEFWANIASSAVAGEGDGEALRAVRRSVSALSPIVLLMAEEKGAYPNLAPYGAILAKLLPSLQVDPLVAGEAKTGAIADRLSPLGKLGLALMDPAKPGPLQEVEDWLTKSNILDEQLRVPFLAPVRVAYEQALRSVEEVAASAYAREMRPLVLPLFERFPFDPSARADAIPGEVQAVLGPKGLFLSAFQDIYGPLTVRDQKGNFSPRQVRGFRSVVLSREALGLGGWANRLAPVLWDASGAPAPITVVLRPTSLAAIRTGALAATTLGVLRSGSTTVAAFNQATTWKALPVEWWTASPAALGIEFTSLDGTSRRALSAEASGSAWRFFHLMCRGTMTETVVRWSLDDSPDRDVAFELRSDPWEPLVPPFNKGRRCSPQPSRE